MILDLILFYRTLERGELSKPYNNRIKEIFLENQNKKAITFDKSIDISFIEKYSREYDKYRPYKIIENNRKNKEVIFK